MAQSSLGGRHELGQNYLNNQATIQFIVGLVEHTQGAILEIGGGRGALTTHLCRLDRPFTVIDIDEHNAAYLRHRFPEARVELGDFLHRKIAEPVVVGNIPFHVTTPIFRHLLSQQRWQKAFLLTQWEVARKRAGVGRSTMMSAQVGPWFTFVLHRRVYAREFTPAPQVDGGILEIDRRHQPLLPPVCRNDFGRLVQTMFQARGRTLSETLRSATGLSYRQGQRILTEAELRESQRPGNLTPEEWARLWRALEDRLL